MTDSTDKPGEGESLEANEEALQDLELTEDAEAESVAGGTGTTMCPGWGDKAFRSHA
jgi:hypothetical protein